MKIKILPIIILHLFSSCVLWSQSLTPQVYASGGTEYSAGGSQMSFTIGEPLTSTYTGSSYTITQGFHQPEIKYSSVEPTAEFIFHVFPNPTQDYISISSNGSYLSDYQLDLIDVNGKIIQSKFLTGDNQQIDLSSVAAGTYHLRIVFNHSKTNSFTIIKTSKY